MKLNTKLHKIKASQGGFTLIELLVVIGILAILLAITLIAINPNKHFEDTRNTQRSSNVSEILNAIYEYESANNGNEPASVSGVTSTPTALADATPTTVATTGATYASPTLTFTVAAGNTVTSGTVTVSSCTVADDNGTFTVTGGTGTTIDVTDNNASAADEADASCSISVPSGNIDVCADLIPTYLAALPMDPTTGTGTQCSASYNTGYTIAQSNGRFTIAAPDAEDSATISVTR
jgi:type IV pilus assembly protein PilA